MNCLVIMLETVIVLVVCYVATEGIKRVLILNRILLGGR